MKRAGIIGWPVSHSLSPLLHGYWLREYGIAGEYVRLAAKPEEFADVIARVREKGFAGVNVTVPHKEAAFKLAATQDYAAVEAQAANLLIFRPSGAIEAQNTDTYGLVQSLRAAVNLTDKTVVMLGAGGAARGAVLALNQLGAARIHILNRHQARAEALAQTLQHKLKARLLPGALLNWPAVAQEASLLINTTSAGMTGHEKLMLDLEPLPPAAAVCDIVYNPLVTELLKNAAARGHMTIDGLGMLMHQAVPSFEAFFGVRPSVTPGLRDALEQALA